MLTNFTSRAELLRRLDEEYQKAMNAIWKNEVRAAEVQRQRAENTCHDGRKWYWEGVLLRVRRGERLDDARLNEAADRDGPFKAEIINGKTYPVRDLDVWYA